MPKLLEKRPEPPELTDILEDLTNSVPNDVAFNFFSANAHSLEVEDIVQQTKGGSAADGQLEKSSKGKAKKSSVKKSSQLSEVDDCYEKVTNLIESYNYLKNSQTSLAEKCSKLEAMGEKVQQQISELKTHLSQS